VSECVGKPPWSHQSNRFRGCRLHTFRNVGTRLSLMHMWVCLARGCVPGVCMLAYVLGVQLADVRKPRTLCLDRMHSVLYCMLMCACDLLSS
jgi:hypothetical protein